MITISPNGKKLAVLYRSPNINNPNWYARVYDFDVNYENLTYETEYLLESSDIVEDIAFSCDNEALYYLWNYENTTTYLKETVLSDPPSTTTIQVPDNLKPKLLTSGSNNIVYSPASNNGSPLLQKMIKLNRTTGTTVLTTETYSPTGSETLIGICPAEIYNLYAPNSDNKYNRTIANKQYELKDHLGNVTAVIDDYKTPVDINNLNSGYTATVSTSSNYYPFGMFQPGRNHNSNEYRFGFNGKENDNEVKGLGNQQDYGFRIYDPRIGRWLSLDPLYDKYPGLSPYCFVGNMPIIAIDPNGEKIVIVYRDERGNKQKYTYQPGMKYEGDNKFVKNTIAALEYVKAGDVNDIIQQVSDHKKTIKIKEIDNFNDHFFTITNTVNWDPTSGLIVLNPETEELTDQKQTPALGLLHELSHGYIKLFKTRKEKRELREEDDHYTDKEEKYIIEKIETPAAEILNEGVRKSHYGLPFETIGPTTIEQPETQVANESPIK